MSNQLSFSDIPEDLWRDIIRHLVEGGWELTHGGGLDHSWVVLAKDGEQVEMEYDRWAEGDIAMSPPVLLLLWKVLPERLRKVLQTGAT